MKKQRQHKIIELVRSQKIKTQGELTDRLAKAGFPATQATVSRDIHELKLTKVPEPGGATVYATDIRSDDKRDEREFERLKRVLRDGFVSMDTAGNLLVIHTLSGMANAVGAALDALRYPEMVGCLAGDDVIMAAMKTPRDVEQVMQKLKEEMLA